jgi:hypothetical protein
MLKLKGQPTQNSTPTPTPSVLGTEVQKQLPTLWFKSTTQKVKITRSQAAMTLLGWMFGI